MEQDIEMIVTRNTYNSRCDGHELIATDLITTYS
jgi:hypothetical protein